MWGHMANQGYMMGGFMMLLWWIAAIWFVVFTILVVVKLDKIISLLEKK
jgi:hypothetical protein